MADANGEINPINGRLIALTAYGRADDVRVMLQSGIVTNVNATVPPTNETSLQIAAARGDTVIVRLLLDANADTEPADYEGKRALVRAVEGSLENDIENYAAIVQMLLQKGAQVNSATGDGWMPLHLACRWGQKKLPIVRQLCHAGADCFAQVPTPNHPGTEATPLDLAINNNNPPDQEVIDFLLQHCSTIIFQRHGNMSVHVILQELQIVRSADNNNNNNNNNNPDRYQLSIGTSLRIDHLLAFLDHLIALDAGTLSALNAENKLPIQVAIARRFPEQITFLLVRHYPDSLVHLSE